ncbi:hypothetical protein Tco_0468793 [Tanacetum coccineum]
MAPLPGRDPLEDGERCQRCTCKWCGHKLREGFCLICASKDGNLSIDVPNPNSFNDLPNVFTHPPQPQYETYSCELCGNDSHHGYDCPSRFPLIKDYRNEKTDIHFRRECESMIDELKGKFNGMSIEINKKKELQHLEQVANLKPEDSLIMGNEELTIPEKELDEFIKSSVEDLVPIPSESEDTSESDSDLPSDDESLSDEDIPEDNVKIYSNPLFEFNDEYISSNVNPLFDEVLESIESKDSYVSNLDEPSLLVTPFSDANEDECFEPGGEIDEIDAFIDMDISTDIEYGYHDSEGDIIYIEIFLLMPLSLISIPRIAPDYEDSRARGFVHRPLDLQSFACLYMGIRYPRSY